MNPREMNSLETLAKSVKSEHSISKEGIDSLPELLEIVSKIDIQDMKDDKIGTILIDAVYHRHQEIVQALLDAKANPNFKENGRPVLNQATGHIGIVRSLLTAKANVNGKADNGVTALFCATVDKKQDVMQLLLAEKADPNIKPKSNRSLLFHAALINCPDLIELLVAGGAKPIVRGENWLSEVDQLLEHYEAPGIGDTIREGVTNEQLDNALSAVNLLLDKGAFFENDFLLYRFLNVCNQKNPHVLNCLTKLCEYENSRTDPPKHETIRKLILKHAPNYLNKLQVVMKYSYSRPHYEVGWWHNLNSKLTKKEVEKLYDKICEYKHPLLSILKPFGISADVKPEDISDLNPSILPKK